MNELIGKKFPVLNDGFIRLVDIMGNDAAIVQAARVSYGAGTKKISEDEGLIRYLMRHGHSTPFEMCELKFHVRVPMDCWRQWIRHRTANVNEYSTRYSEAINSCQTTEPDKWRKQGKGNKQGGKGFVTNVPPYGKKIGEVLSQEEKGVQDCCRHIYNARIQAGVAREQARKDLPLSTYTEAYWKMDLRNLLHFLGLRMDSHAQQEIRQYATIMGEQIVAPLFPITWRAFNDYHPKRNALLLTAREVEIMSILTQQRTCELIGSESILIVEKLKEFGWFNKTKTGKLKRNRERTECEEKLQKFGLEIPWLV